MLSNEVNIKLISGESGETLFDHTDHNDFADDILVCRNFILTNIYSTSANPYCFLQPDGPRWSSYSWNRRDPYVPYPITMNKNGDSLADSLYAGHSSAQRLGNRWRLFYRWTQLPQDIQLKAVGLFDWENYGLNQGVDATNPTLITPATLVILPQALSIKGRLNGTQTPDILEVSYYLSLTGVQ